MCGPQDLFGDGERLRGKRRDPSSFGRVGSPEGPDSVSGPYPKRPSFDCAVTPLVYTARTEERRTGYLVPVPSSGETRGSCLDVVPSVRWTPERPSSPKPCDYSCDPLFGEDYRLSTSLSVCDTDVRRGSGSGSLQSKNTR